MSIRFSVPPSPCRIKSVPDSKEVEFYPCSKDLVPTILRTTFSSGNSEKMILDGLLGSDRFPGLTGVWVLSL